MPVAEAKALQAAKPNATLKIVEGMNHVMKTVTDPAKQLASYADPTLPIVADVPAATADFVRGIYSSGATAPRRPTAQRVSLRDTVLGEVDGVRSGDRVRPAVEARPGDLGHARAVGQAGGCRAPTRRRR